MSTKMVTIAGIQAKASKDAAANLAKTEQMVRRAAKKGAQIICLQELYRTIYFPQYQKAKSRSFAEPVLPALSGVEGSRAEGIRMTAGRDRKRDPAAFAETIPGESTEAFQRLAREFRIVIIVPVFERSSEGQYYNAAVVIDEKGKLLPTYRKVHLPQDPLFYEQNYFAPGEEGSPVYRTKHASFAVLLCYDQWFPEAARMATLAGAEIIFYPTAIGAIVGYRSQDGDWHDAWETVMRGHAIANGVHVVAVNRVGREDRLRFWGQSFACDSFGKILRRANAGREEVMVAKLDLLHNWRIREGWGFLRNRRPETYRLAARSASTNRKT